MPLLHLCIFVERHFKKNHAIDKATPIYSTALKAFNFSLHYKCDIVTKYFFFVLFIFVFFLKYFCLSIVIIVKDEIYHDCNAFFHYHVCLINHGYFPKLVFFIVSILLWYPDR